MIGRFISADTVAPDPYNPQSRNKYTYCFNNPLRYTDPTGNWPKWLDDAVSWVGEKVRWVGEKVVEGAKWVGEKVVEGVEQVREQVAEGVEWVVGIEEVKTIYNPLLGDKPVKVITSKNSGLNLVNKVLDGLDAQAVAVGGPVGILSKPDTSEQVITHECQHIKEQREVGWIGWHAEYIGEYLVGAALWGSWEEAYDYHPAERRAREVAGQPQPTQPPTWADWWPWAWFIND